MNTPTTKGKNSLTKTDRLILKRAKDDYRYALVIGNPYHDEKIYGRTRFNETPFSRMLYHYIAIPNIPNHVWLAPLKGTLCALSKAYVIAINAQKINEDLYYSKELIESIESFGWNVSFDMDAGPSINDGAYLSILPEVIANAQLACELDSPTRGALLSFRCNWMFRKIEEENIKTVIADMEKW